MPRPRFLLCFILAFVSAAQVPPPTNVTLTCRNLQNILSWNYDNVVPGLRFLVKIGSTSELHNCPTERWVDQPSLQANVSFLPEPDSATYWIRVQAVLGGNESALPPENGIKFSYFHGANSQKCLLDFPAVNVTPMEDDHIQSQFQHPWLMYKDYMSGCQKRLKKKRHEEDTALPFFVYTVKVVGQDKFHTFECDEDVCKNKLQVDAAQDEHCLDIEGMLEKMTVKSPKKFCSLKASPPLNLTGLIVGISSVVIVAVIVVALMVFWKKTTPILKPPHTLIFVKSEKDTDFKPLDDLYSPVQPVSVLMRPEEEDENPASLVESQPREEVHMKLSPIDPGFSEDMEEENAAHDNDPYMGRCLDDDEQESEEEAGRSPYEGRAVVVQMGPEDRAEGYRG